LVGGDTIADLSQSFDSKNAGNRTLNVNAGYVVDDGNNGGNYTVNLVSAFGTITPAQLTLSAVTDSKVYDGTTSDGLTPTESGLVGGDTIADLSQSFDSKNAGNRTLGVNAGYAIDDGNNGGNYTVNLVSAFGTITPKPLTVDLIGGVFKIYDGNTIATLTASNYLLVGVIDNDKVELNPPTTGSYDTPFQGTGKVVTVGNFTLFGPDAGDYTVKGSFSAPIGTICLAGCVLPPVYGNLLTVPGLLGQLQFGFIFDFPDGGDFPVTPDDGSSRKGDRFPVTGAGNRDLWTGPQINLDAATGAKP